MKRPIFIPLHLVVFAIAGSVSLPSRAAATAPTETRFLLADSIKEVPIGAPESGPHRVRETLTSAESAAALNLVVSLRMRNFAQFQAALQSGRALSSAEMEADYLPLQADYDRVAAWLLDQGFVPTLSDANHTNLFFRGTIGRIADALDVSFARVATADGEFTSAITAPSVPAEIAPVILGMEGLQPHIQMHGPKLQAASLTPDVAHPTRAIPADVLKAYNMPANLNGAGQTIAIFATALPLASDLATFDQLTGTNEVPASFTVVPVNGGPISGAYPLNEVTLDTEWSTGIAPGANLRIYAAPTGGLSDFESACTQILNDGIAKIVSSSYSNAETEFAPASLQSASQLLAQMAAAGITVFHGAGDNGAYSASNPPEYPTTDPYVTALGGTAMTFDANWNETSETVWPNTGGGYSTVFPQPSWQTGPGLLNGTMRCVPDAAAPASTISSTGVAFGFVVLNGATNTGIGGDSATGPIWAGLTAIINQARASAGLPTVGLLGPKIYPLIGTSAFTDITVGSDGAYSAGPGYDLCSGVGTPNMANLIAVLATPVAPAITLPPSSQTVATGRTVVFNVSATGAPAPTYQWTLNGSTTIPGASVTNDPILVITGSTAADDGTITCTATNSVSSVSSSATLSVITTTTPGYLDNLSGRGLVGSGASNALYGGFGISGTGTKQLLIRGMGPSLLPGYIFTVSDALLDTQLTLFNNNSVPIGSNSPWGGTAALMAADSLVGAYPPVSTTSLDSMLYAPVGTGPSSASVGGVNNDVGDAVIEIYDADSLPLSAKLTNVSVRAPVGTGNDILFGGFAIGGSTSETVLIRAIGPGLATTFSNQFTVAQVLAQPVLSLYVGGTFTGYTNTGWGSDPALINAMLAVGAYPLVDGSCDSLLLVTLPPGSYSAEIAGLNGTTGIAVVEIYEVY